MPGCSRPPTVLPNSSSDIRPAVRYTAYLGLGSNLGNSPRILDAAVQTLRVHPRILAVRESSRRRTDPVGEGYNASFLNSAVRLNTDCDPTELLALTQSIEAAHGRDRSRSDRTLDIDLLLVYDAMSARWLARKFDPVLPHPRMHARPFVLEPLTELLQPDELAQALQS